MASSTVKPNFSSWHSSAYISQYVNLTNTTPLWSITGVLDDDDRGPASNWRDAIWGVSSSQPPDEENETGMEEDT